MPLEHVRCECRLSYRARGDGVIEVAHVGSHRHLKPPVVRATKRALREYAGEAAQGLRVPPKKKASPSTPSAPLMRMWTLSASGSTGLELRQHGTWSLS